MIDMHCHILPGIDDGSKNLEESMLILENAATSGVTDIIFTPHYIKGTKYCYDNRAKKQLTEILVEAMKRTDLEINVHFGNEVYIDQNIPEMLENGEIATLAGSRYLLLELPVATEDLSAPDLIFRLKSQGITPIIAHPERYDYFTRDLKKIDRYLELGCLMQGDYMSILGKYGKAAKKSLTKLLKANKIQMLASDIHHSSSDYHIPEVEKKLMKILKSDDKIQNLMIENPERIIKNLDIK